MKSEAYEKLDRKLDYLIKRGCKIDKGNFLIGFRLFFEGDITYYPHKDIWWVGKNLDKPDETYRGGVRKFVNFLEGRKNEQN